MGKRGEGEATALHNSHLTLYWDIPLLHVNFICNNEEFIFRINEASY